MKDGISFVCLFHTARLKIHAPENRHFDFLSQRFLYAQEVSGYSSSREWREFRGASAMPEGLLTSHRSSIAPGKSPHKTESLCATCMAKKKHP